MLFRGSKKIIYDNAYQSYREIMEYINLLFCDENSIYINDNTTLVDNIVISTDIYIQLKLFEIANADEKISEDECYFITSLIDNSDIIKKIEPLYRQFIIKTNADTFKALIDNGLYHKTGIPEVLNLSIKNDLLNNTSESFEIINKLEIVFKSIVELDNLDSKSEKYYCNEEIERLRKYLKEQGVCFKNIDKATTNNNDSECDSIITELLEELNSLTGLKTVKQDINSTINFININEMRKQNGMPKIPVSNHMVFLGNPGTGKTTVARLIAKIYKELGVVSKGQLIETDRAGLVAGYVGQTALKTKEVVRRAIGGVLFIDEAYSLTSSDGQNDFGNEAIDTLVKLMEDNRDNLVVIVAGYSDQMHKFIDSNPGLSSRFSRYFNFEDYSYDELIEIFKNICRKNGFVVSESAIKILKEVIESKNDMGKFGNARGIRNIFDKAILNQADRLMHQKDINKSDLSTIIASDIGDIESLRNIEKNIGFSK